MMTDISKTAVQVQSSAVFPVVGKGNKISLLLLLLDTLLSAL